MIYKKSKNDYNLYRGKYCLKIAQKIEGILFFMKKFNKKAVTIHFWVRKVD